MAERAIFLTRRPLSFCKCLLPGTGESLDVFAAVAAEVTHLLPVQIDDVVSAPGCRSFLDEVGIRRLSHLNLLIYPLESFCGKFSRDLAVLQCAARYQRLPAPGVVAKFVAQEVHVIGLDSPFGQACENLGEGDLSRQGLADQILNDGV